MNSSQHFHNLGPQAAARVSPVTSPATGLDPHGPAAAACGWYESSLALRQGLQVIELDASAAARWFGTLLDRAQPAALQ